jgi:hypothetical protein
MNSRQRPHEVRLRGLLPRVRGAPSGIRGSGRAGVWNAAHGRAAESARADFGDVVAAVSTAWDGAGRRRSNHVRIPGALRSSPPHRKRTKGTELDSVAQSPYMRRGATWTTGVDSVGTSCGVRTWGVGTWTGWGQPGFPTHVVHTGGRARRWLRDRRMTRAGGGDVHVPTPSTVITDLYISMRVVRPPRGEPGQPQAIRGTEPYAIHDHA